MKTILTILALVFLVAWSDDPGVNTPICDFAGSQNHSQLIADGSGGAIITWQDYRTGNADIYVQRMDKDGNALWNADGIAICKAVKDQLYPRIISDGAGGAIITWMDCRGSSPDIYAQRINAKGARYWAINGVAVCKAAKWQSDPQIISSSSNGAIIAWIDNRRDVNEVYAQRINKNGAAVWALNGIPVCSNRHHSESFKLLPDNINGAIIIWENADKILGQKLTVSGTRKWSANGKLIQAEWAANCDRLNFEAAADRTGGAVVTWSTTNAGGLYKSAVERVDTNGILQWSEQVSTDTLTLKTSVVCDGTGNIFVLADEFGEGDVYIHKINLEGQFLWVQRVYYILGEFDSEIALDGSGGVLVAIKDGHTESTVNLFANRVDANGNNVWNQLGVQVSIANGSKSSLHLVPDGTGGAIFAWMDKRTGVSDIYGQRVYADGTLSGN
jgi:hypothetical protein